MNIEALRERLTLQKADFEIIHHEVPIKSKKDALGYFKIEETAPTLIIKTENGFYAVIISGERKKVDFEIIRNLLGCKTIGLANKQVIVDNFQVEPGQVPLIGHHLPCIIDNKIFNFTFVYGGTGDLFHTLKINPADLVKANNVILKFD